MTCWPARTTPLPVVSPIPESPPREGSVQLIAPADLPAAWDLTTIDRISVWEGMCQRGGVLTSADGGLPARSCVPEVPQRQSKSEIVDYLCCPTVGILGYNEKTKRPAPSDRCAGFIIG